MNNQLFDSVVRKLEEAKDQEGNAANIYSIKISQRSDVYKHVFKKEHRIYNIRSISKPVVCMALGIAMEEGLRLRGERLTVETNIWPFFEKIVNLTNTKNLEKLRKVKLKHLLTHTMGYDIGFLFVKEVRSRDEYSLLDYVFNRDIIYEPGEHFAYTNVGPYLISAMIHEELGENYSDFVNRKLFQKIGITDYQWTNYGKYCAGATGLKLSIDDLHKIGLVWKQDGKYKGIQVVPKSWIEQMRTPKVKVPAMSVDKRVLPMYEYGYYIWLCKDGNYFCYGTDGQYVVVSPEKDMVISTLSDQIDMTSISECVSELL